MSTKSIYIFRHGETEWNRIGRLQGHSDIPLNAAGVSQAQSLKSFLEPILKQQGPSPRIYSSMLERAKATAIHATGRTPTTNALLNEAHLGAAEGMTREEIIENFGEESLRKWSAEENPLGDFAFPGGESRQNVLVRLKEFFRELHLDVSKNPHSESVIIVSTHGLALRTLLIHLAGRLIDRIPNCACFKLQLHLADGRLEWPEPQINYHQDPSGLLIKI